MKTQVKLSVCSNPFAWIIATKLNGDRIVKEDFATRPSCILDREDVQINKHSVVEFYNSQTAIMLLNLVGFEVQGGAK